MNDQSIQNLHLLVENDRRMLLSLTQELARIAERISELNGSVVAWADLGEDDSAAHSACFSYRNEKARDRPVRAPRPPLPDPRLVRTIIRQRQLRARFLESNLFSDPAWDMLLDLTAARAEHTRVSVTSLCIASGVPPTTALRWIGQMTEAGLFERIEDEADRRRAFIALTDKAADAMARYFAALGRGATRLI